MVCTVMSVRDLGDEGTEGGPSLRYVCERGGLQRWEGGVEGHGHGANKTKEKRKSREAYAEEMGEEKFE